MLSNTLKQLRKSHGMSQADFAKAIGVTQGAISQWELGKTAPSSTQMQSIAQYFNVSIDKLLGINNPALEDHAPVETSAQVGDVFVTTVPQIAMMGREMEKMSPKQRDQMLAVGKALFKEYFGKEADET